MSGRIAHGIRAATAALALGGGVPAVAGPLLIAPTTIQFEGARRSAAIEITNESDDPVDLQFRAFAWDQPDGQERLTPTDRLAISPPIATLPPRGKQVFRVLDLATADDTAERSYRLKLNELPRAGSAAIAINLEFSLPVFRTPAGGEPRLAWSAEDAGRIRLANTGTRRLRIASLSLAQADGTTVPLRAANYLLANSARAIALPPGTRIGAGARLSGTSDAGPIDVPLSALAAR